jgi:transcription elongation factor Elf1
MWNGPLYKNLYTDPAEGEREYRISASKQTDGTTQFTLFCPFDNAVSTVNSIDQPAAVRCSNCGRDFSFPFSMGPW